MKTFFELTTKGRKSHLRYINKLKRMKSTGWKGYAVLFIRGECSFRQIERLHKAGLVTACASKVNWMGKGNRPFRELAVYLTEQEALERYSKDVILPRV